MRWPAALRIAFLLSTVPLGLAACSSNSPGAATPPGDAGSEASAGDSGCPPYHSTADLSTPVSFGSNVMPIFQQNCAAQQFCHGDPNFAPLQPVLGSPDGGIDAATVLSQIVGVKSVEDPTMNLVAARDPANSYLMHKLDGDQCTLAQQCKGTAYSSVYPNCGSQMPLSAVPLAVTDRDTVRAWIQQGAN